MTCLFTYILTTYEKINTTLKLPFQLLYRLDCLAIPVLPNAAFFSFCILFHTHEPTWIEPPLINLFALCTQPQTSVKNQ